MKCDIGHFEIKAGGSCYNLIPSFENIMKLGDGEELIDHYSVLHGINDYPENTKALYDYNMYTIGLSSQVIRACSDKDISNLLVDVVDRNETFKLKKSTSQTITPEQQVIVAAGLLRHGISGVNKDKKKTKGESAKTIDLWDFVNTARVHLEITKEEALSLTMTEFNRMMDIKYPPEKNAAEEITDEEYDEAMANLARINKIRDVH